MDLGKMGELKKMYDKYKELQKALKNLVIRAKEWEFTDENWEKSSSVIIDMTWEMKIVDVLGLWKWIKFQNHSL